MPQPWLLGQLIVATSCAFKMLSYLYTDAVRVTGLARRCVNTALIGVKYTR